MTKMNNLEYKICMLSLGLYFLILHCLFHYTMHQIYLFNNYAKHYGKMYSIVFIVFFLHSYEYITIMVFFCIKKIN